MLHCLTTAHRRMHHGVLLRALPSCLLPAITGNSILQSRAVAATSISIVCTGLLAACCGTVQRGHSATVSMVSHGCWCAWCSSCRLLNRKAGVQASIRQAGSAAEQSYSVRVLQGVSIQQCSCKLALQRQRDACCLLFGAACDEPVGCCAAARSTWSPVNEHGRMHGGLLQCRAWSSAVTRGCEAHGAV